MGAPGTLIPAEVQSGQLPNSFFDIRSFADVTVLPTEPSLLHSEGIGPVAVSKVGSSRSDEASYGDNQPKEDERTLLGENQTERCEYEFDKLLSPLQGASQSSLGASGKASSAQKRKVKNVSKYVISAAKNPEFAQKLHAVLLESGASPPPDLFLDIGPQDLDEEKVLEQIHAVHQKIAPGGVHSNPDNLRSSLERSLIPFPGGKNSNHVNIGNMRERAPEGFTEKQNKLETHMDKSKFLLTSDNINEGFMVVDGPSELTKTDVVGMDKASSNPSNMYMRALHEEQVCKAPIANSCQRYLENGYLSDDMFIVTETVNSGLLIGCDDQSKRINPVLGEVAEWEIQWEDLRIGERIGIGKKPPF